MCEPCFGTHGIGLGVGRGQRLVLPDDGEDDEPGEVPDSCLNWVDGHWYVVTYGRAPYTIHAQNCATCAEEQEKTHEH